MIAAPAVRCEQSNGEIEVFSHMTQKPSTFVNTSSFVPTHTIAS